MYIWSIMITWSGCTTIHQPLHWCLNWWLSYNNDLQRWRYPGIQQCIITNIYDHILNDETIIIRVSSFTDNDLIHIQPFHHDITMAFSPSFKIAVDNRCVGSISTTRNGSTAILTCAPFVAVWSTFADSLRDLRYIFNLAFGWMAVYGCWFRIFRTISLQSSSINHKKGKHVFTSAQFYRQHVWPSTLIFLCFNNITSMQTWSPGFTGWAHTCETVDSRFPRDRNTDEQWHSQ